MSDTPATQPAVSERYRLLAFILPLVIFAGMSALEPSAAPSEVSTLETGADPADAITEQLADESELTTNGNSWWPLPASAYPIVFSLKVVLTGLCVAFFWRFYCREFPLRVSWLAFVVGVVGVVAWVGLWHLHAEDWLIELLGGPDSTAASWLGLSERVAFNPLENASESPGMAWGFLAVRFIGLVLLVPIIEELFLRAFFMRYVMHDNWWQIPFGEVNRMAVIVGIALPVLYHPEKLSALVWFSMVTWLMVRTRNFWDCVVAHAVTNLLLGIYVVTFSQWALW
jgi:uncharacterized protein